MRDRSRNSLRAGRFALGMGMTVSFYRNTVALVALSLTLAACESSSRLGSLLPDDSLRPAARTTPQAPQPLTPAPSTDVDTQDLPPPPGAGAVAPLPGPGATPGLPAGGVAAGGVATAPGAPLGTQPPATQPQPGTQPPGTQPPGANPAAPRVAGAAAASAAPTRTGVIGNWSLAETAGGRCRITLSSAPKLDLYGAGTSGCQSKELQRVNAWELNGSEVILYEPGGGVVARLRQSGAQNFSGAVAKTGAPISISK